MLIDRAPEPARGELTGRNEKPVISVADNLGRPDWYTVQVFPALYRDKPARTIVLNNVTDLKNQEKKLHEANTLIEHRMNHDARTGLASERRFFNRLRRALRLQDDEERVGLIVIELQDVEEISQQHGPEALDEVLQELAVNMLENLQDKQLVGRVGTGRFAILYQEVTNDAELLGRADELREALDIVISLDSGPVSIRVRLAVVLADIEEADPEYLFRNAEVALSSYRGAKAPAISLFNADMRKQIDRRTRLYSELKDGLRMSEIEPYFQPKIRLRDDHLLGFEVLARWNHGTDGLVPPGIFVTIAEQTGLLPAIDDNLLAKAIEALVEWRQSGNEQLGLSVNASKAALQDEGFVDRFLLELERQDVPPDAMSIEISESMTTGGMLGRVIDMTDRLQTAGVSVELDNFGTRGASINTLVRLGVKTVKIDRSLIDGLHGSEDDRRVVAQIIKTVKDLGRDAHAEGIESDAQVAELIRLGCDFGQGYHIGRPMSVEDATSWLAYRSEQIKLRNAAA